MLTSSAAAGQSLAPQSLTAHVTIDWSAGLMVAKGLGLADRRAPAPDVARAAARSRGVAQARQRMSDALLLVPWADGKGSAAQLTSAQLATLVDMATLRAAQPQTDGGWQIELQLSLEVLRQAVRGNRKLPVAGDDVARSEIALDARKLRLRPTVGLQINDGGTTVECATRWVTSWPGPSTKVRSVNAGLLELSKPVGIKPATLCVIIVSQ
ncbi:MAG: hypothetical protein KBG15_03925 [Kofleriaceae bacterium]|nr:hypothetical protein [Kofleriaceae bacterium]